MSSHQVGGRPTTNLCSLPRWISASIYFFKLKQSFSVLVVILVKVTILVMISLFRWGLDSLGPFDACVILEVQKHLLHGHVKESVVLEPTRGRLIRGLTPWLSLSSLARLPLSSLVAYYSLFLLFDYKPAPMSCSCRVLRVSSAFMCCCAFTMRLAMWDGDFLRKRKGT